MHEDELMITDNGEDLDIMLPDGWSEDKDFFDLDSWSTTESQSGQTEETAEDGTETEVSDGEDDTPTTGDTDDAADQSADDETDNTQSGQTEEPVKASRILKLKVNHEDRETDINAMTDEELIERLQKSYAFDAMKDDQAKARYRQVYQKQVENGMTEAVAKLVAQNEVGKAYPLVDPEDSPAPTVQTETKTVETDIDVFRNQVQKLKTLYPDFKEMPNEVALAINNGVDPISAYVAYREKQTSKAAASLKKENEVLKQNAASAAKAPVKGVTGGGTAQTKVDPWLEAFEKDYW